MRSRAALGKAGVAGGLALLLIAALSAARADGSADVWSPAAALDLKAARRALADLPEGAAGREVRLQRAMLTIVTPPQTESRFDAVARELDALAAGPERDAIAAEAAYQSARLAQTRGRDSAAELMRRYEAVWTRFPGTPQAERAFVFAAIVRQHYPNEPAAAKRAALLALDREAEARLQTDTARRLYHLAASMAWARLLHDDDQACAHLEIVYRLGLDSAYTFSDVLFRLGEYHRRRGDRAGARRYFREFVERYPVDRRTDLARRLIADLSPDATP